MRRLRTVQGDVRRKRDWQWKKKRRRFLIEVRGNGTPGESRLRKRPFLRS